MTLKDFTQFKKGICLLWVFLVLCLNNAQSQNFFPQNKSSENKLSFYSTIIQVDTAKRELQSLIDELQRLEIRVGVQFKDILILQSTAPIDQQLSTIEYITIINEESTVKDGEWLQYFMHPDNSLESNTLSLDHPEEQEGCILKSTEGEIYAIGSSDNKILMCYKNPWELCSIVEWPEVLAQVDIVKIYIGDINSRVDVTQARCFISHLLENNIKIAIELGGLLDWHADKLNNSAAASFEQEVSTVNMLIDMIKSIDPKRTIDILELDGPIRRMLFPNNIKSNFHNLNSAIDELYKVVKMWKDHIPDVKINLLTNFPNWAWDNTPAYFAINGESKGYGQYRDVMNQLRSRNRDLKYRIDGLTIDNPYNYALGIAPTNQPSVIANVDWFKRIKELESNAKLLGLDVNMIYNTEGAKTDSLYYGQTLEYIEKYRSEGGRPNGYWIQSWYDRPTKWLPEDEAYTMTNLVKSALPLVKIQEIDPNRTSDFMEGSSVVVLFFVQNANAPQTGAPAWNDSKQAAAIANVVANLLWWTDQAALYGKIKTFELEVFGYTHPATQMDFDPTEGYTSTGSNNSKFIVPIMQRLGQTNTNPILATRAFAHEMRTAKEKKWGFCAYLLEGAFSVRAHASLQGPLTVLTRSNTANGFTFAHEVGHIYGAFDEYWESGAIFRQNQSRYGIPNGNFRWRNHPIQPSMMGSSASSGISYYTAGHLKLTDKVRYTTIKTYPENAIYEVAYVLANGQKILPTRYQGITRFHWGEGTQLLLNALPTVTVNNMVYDSPSWSIGNSDHVSFVLDKNTPPEIFLQYNPTQEESNQQYTYLHTGNALATFSISSLIKSDEWLATTGIGGLSVWDGKNRIILDNQRNTSIPAPYEGAILSANDHGNIAFGNTNGPIVTFDTKTGNADVISTSTTYRILEVSNDNILWAAIGPDGRVKDGESAPEGLHKIFNNNIEVINTSNSNIPSDNVSGIVESQNGVLMVGFNGPTNNARGLYKFYTSSNLWEDISHHLPNTRVKKIKKSNNAIIIEYDGGFSVYKDNTFRRILPSLPQNIVIYDYSLDQYDNFYIATSQGLYVYDDQKSLLSIYNTTNSSLMTNICTSVCVSNENTIYVGGPQGVTVIYNKTATPSSVDNAMASVPFIFPNPVSDKLYLSVASDHPIDYIIKIVTLQGETIYSQHHRSSEIEIDVSEFTTGIYIVQVGNKNIKFMVMR